MINYTRQEIEHVKEMLESFKKFDLVTEESKEYIEKLTKEIDTVNEIEEINQLMYNFLDENYAYYFLYMWRYKMTWDELLEELESDDIYNEHDYSIFEKIYCEEAKRWN